MNLILLANNYSMIGPLRLKNFLDQIDYIKLNNINGCIVECGVWKGGAICMIKSYLLSMNDRRNVHAFDSFEGLPTPTSSDFLIGSGILASDICGIQSDPNNNCKVDLNDFYNTMNIFSLKSDDIKIHKGWFKNTAQNFNEDIAVLRFDGDWYESTKDILLNMFHKVVEGGVLIFDDYGYWNGNKKAVDEFLNDNKLSYIFNYTDSGEMWFVK